MEPRKLNVYIAKLAYGGNSGFPFTSAAVSDWLDKLIPTLRDDPRIGRVVSKSFSNTPADFVRNQIVVSARAAEADVVLMIDSDSAPDLYDGQDSLAVPFWKAAFDFLYAHYEDGPVVVGAPYCGPPPVENIFVFKWRNKQSDHPNIDCALAQYEREEAAVMAGVQECAALPTGLILYDMRLFDFTEPKLKIEETVDRLTDYWLRRFGAKSGEVVEPGTITMAVADVRGIVDHAVRERLRLEKPWFYYEYADETCSNKVSTEDVTNTRDISLMGMAKLGYNPVFCAWDSWCGHLKAKVVGKPFRLAPEDVHEKYARVMRDNAPARGMQLREVNFRGR